LAETADAIVVGGGIAGAGAAFELSPEVNVVLLESEEHCGHHATGRSAASFTETYGPPTIRRLARASRPFLEEPPDGFASHPLMSARGTLTIAREDQVETLAASLEAARAFVPTMREVSAAEALALVPFLQPGYVAAAMLEPEACEIDVAGLHQGFLAGARRRGARIETRAAVIDIRREGATFTVETPRGAFEAPLLINAAGAWADDVATLAGLRRLGLAPKRRTALLVPAPDDAPRAFPLVDDVAGEFYFKRDAGNIFVSPADATDWEAADAYPDDLDVAVAVDRLEQATTIVVRRVLRAWAGLRTFAPDGAPVVGADPRMAGFVWLAGQGGYGIKTAPALSRAAAALALGRPFPDDLARLGVTADELSPARFA
jgi:D-arginine dehydrogenase